MRAPSSMLSISYTSMCPLWFRHLKCAMIVPMHLTSYKFKDCGARWRLLCIHLPTAWIGVDLGTCICSSVSHASVKLLKKRNLASGTLNPWPVANSSIDLLNAVDSRKLANMRQNPLANHTECMSSCASRSSTNSTSDLKSEGWHGGRVKRILSTRSYARRRVQNNSTRSIIMSHLVCIGWTLLLCL
jgi:hypothetical protein